VIYLDTSVAIAHLLAEDRRPPAGLWDRSLVSSRLLEYELWTRVHARRLAKSHGHLVSDLLLRLALIEMISPVLLRALEPFPPPVRTLDALHLATLVFLHEQGQDVRLATYDTRQRAAASALGIDVVDLDREI
jgi:predicted nucleic acid-binding protein